jgi:hypothetical protein
LTVSNPASKSRFAKISFSEFMCVPMALGCQLAEAVTSVHRRFSGNSQASSALDPARAIRVIRGNVIVMSDTVHIAYAPIEQV